MAACKSSNTRACLRPTRRPFARLRMSALIAIVGVVSGMGWSARPAAATGDASLNLGLANGSVVLTPEPVFDLASDVERAYPGGEVEFSATLTYDAAQLSASALVSAENDGDVTGTVEYLSVVWERRATGQGSWQPFASFHQARTGWTPVVAAPQYIDFLAVSAAGIPASGVTYPIAPLSIVGATIGSSDAASWDLSVTWTGSAGSLPALLDPLEYNGIRQVVHMEISPRNGQLGQAFFETVDMTNHVQATDPLLTDATVKIVLPDEDEANFDSTSTPALEEIALGDAPILVQAPFTLPGTTGKGPGESDEDYLNRLQTYGTLEAHADLEAGAYAGQTTSSDNARVGQRLPIVRAVELGADGVERYDTYRTSVELTSIGLAEAIDVSVTASIDTIEGTADEPVTLQSGATANIGIEYSLPSTFPEGVAATSAEVAWKDAANNTYGPIATGRSFWVVNRAEGAPHTGVGSHSPGSTSFGEETIGAWVWDEETSVDSVQLIIDDSVVGEDLSDPFEFVWDTTTENPGPHVLQVRATDSESNVTTSIPVPVSVDNQLSSANRVAVDAAEGRLSTDDAGLYGIYAISGRELLPDRYASTTPTSGDLTGQFWTNLANWEALAPETLDTITDHLSHQFDDMSGYYTANLEDIWGFAEHCSIFASCQVDTDHFHIEFGVQPSAHWVPEVDVLNADLSTCNGVNPSLGECNHIPDYIDQVAAGLESGWDAYVGQLGYDPPVTAPNLVPVVVTAEVSDCGGFVGNEGPIQISHADCEGGIHLGRHEFFHWIQRAGFDNDPWATLGMIAGSCSSRDCLSFLWWNEATAEWATHQAKDLAPVTGDTTGSIYVGNAANFVRTPELPLSTDNNAHEYGAFLLAEFLEERFPTAGDIDAYCLADPESEDCVINPDPATIKEVWEQIWSGHRPFDAIATVATNHSSNMTELLGSFTRANYLLDAKVSGHRVAGSYADTDASIWRTALDNATETQGDNPGSTADNRPGHKPPRRLDLTSGAFDTSESVWIEPGGASYLEFALPSEGSRYGVSVFAIDSEAPLAVDAVAFSGYPTFCAELPLVVMHESFTSAEGTFLIPDECTSITIMLSHTEPLSWDGMAVVIRLWPIDVVDAFERSSGPGWGTSTLGAPWRVTGAAGAGSVADGHARLGEVPVSGQRMVLWSGIESVEFAAHFTDCADSDSQVFLEFGTFVAIGSDGTLTRLDGGSPIAIPDFDPCKPFLVRASWADQDLSLAIWQAMQKEPAATTYTPTGLNQSDILRIHAVGIDSGDAVLFDAIDLQLFSHG